MATPLRLVKFQPDSARDVAELERQRVVRLPVLPGRAVGSADAACLKLCGWGLENVEGWREEVRRGDKVRVALLSAELGAYSALTGCPSQGLYWIFAKPAHEAQYALPDEERLSLSPESLGPASPDPTFRPLGHVSLDWTDYMNDDSLASK